MNGKSGSYIIVKAESGKEVKFDFYFLFFDQ